MESVQREEESLWLEVFVKQLGLRMVAVGSRGESEVETEVRLHVVNLYISVIDQK